MRILTIAILVIVLFSISDALIRFRGELYHIGKKVETTERDIKLSQKYFREYMKQRPNEDIYGYVTAGGVSKGLRHLVIRCIVRNGEKPLSRVFARLTVDMYDPEYFDYRRMRNFYVAITDTLRSNETRTFLFTQPLNPIDSQDMVLFSHYRNHNNPALFRWTFTPSSVRRFRGK